MRLSYSRVSVSEEVCTSCPKRSPWMLGSHSVFTGEERTGEMMLKGLAPGTFFALINFLNVRAGVS